MDVELETKKEKFIAPKRFVSVDFGRGLAILLMLILHNIMHVLDLRTMLEDIINDLAMIQILALVIIPFLGGLAGFFLLASATGNMISIYRDHENGKSVGSIVFKQVTSGFLLLLVGMVIESITGYYGFFGEIARNLNNFGNVFSLDGTWQVIRYRFNHFETIHTIGWCMILNGIIHGLLSIRNNWKNRKRMIIIYAILAVVVVGVTQPIWTGVGNLVEGYPFGTYPNGNELYMPWIRSESWKDIFRAMILNPLAGREEPVFPYLAVSFIGSIIGIAITQPKEKVTKKFTKASFGVGLAMFIGGLIGIVTIIINIANKTDFDTALLFYKDLALHRNWSSDNKDYIPMFAWVAQFLAVNGFSLILLTFLFRLVEFRGKSKQFAEKTKLIRRFGIVALSNYSNQWIYLAMFGLTSFMITSVPYQQYFWGGTILNILITLGIFSVILILWEKIVYTGSYEWYIRTFTNNVVPIRRERVDAMVKLRQQEELNIDYTKSKVSIWFKKFGLRLRGKVVDDKLKWWQRGQIDVENTMINPNWVDFVEDKSTTNMIETGDDDSRLAFRLAMIGMCTIIFVPLSFFALVIGLKARKKEGENKHNKTAVILSIITIFLLVVFVIVTSILKIGVLGIF